MDSLLQLAETLEKESEWDEALDATEQAQLLHKHSKKIRDKESEIRDNAISCYLNSVDSLTREWKWREAIQRTQDARKYATTSYQEERISDKRDESVLSAQECHVRRSKEFAFQGFLDKCLEELDLASAYGSNREVNELRAKFLDQKKALSFLEQGKKLIADSQYVEAVDILQEAYKLNPDNEEISENLNDSYLSLIDEKESGGYIYDALLLLDKASQFAGENDWMLNDRISDLKNTLKLHYEVAITLCEEAELYGHATLYIDLLKDLGVPFSDLVDRRIEEKTKETATQDFAILPFDNVIYNNIAGKDYGKLIANRLRTELDNNSILRGDVKFLNRNQIDKIENEYRYIRDNLMRESDSRRQGSMAAADFLLVGTVNEFRVVERKLVNRKSKSVEYASGSHYEMNPKWEKWAEQKRKFDECIAQYGNEDAGWLCLLVAPGKEPQKRIKVTDYSYHNYYEEYYQSEGDVELYWNIVDMRTTEDILNDTKRIHHEDADKYVEGFDPAGVPHDPLIIATSAEIEEDLLHGIVDEVEGSIARFLTNMPHNLLDRSIVLENQGRDVEAVEVLMMAWTLDNHNSSFKSKRNSVKESLKIDPLTKSSLAALKSSYSVNEDTIQVIADDEVNAFVDSDGQERMDKKLLSSITNSIIDQHYDLARTQIKLFLEKYPESPLLEQVLEISDKISGK